MGKRIMKTMALAGVLFLMFCLVVFLAQRRMMYFPLKLQEQSYLRQGARIGLIPWRNGTGQFIGWRAPDGRGPAEGRAVVFCGNAGNALGRMGYVMGFQGPAVRGRWEVLILEYPGYGSRPGHPSEASLVAAGLEALDQLSQEPRLPTVLVGESLGSGVAALCASKRAGQVDGLFLVTPFNRMRDVAAFHYPVLPSILVLDRYEGAEALKAWHGRLALLVAENDSIIPARFGRKLFDGFAGPKRLWTARGADHNDWGGFPGHPMWREVTEFLSGP